MKICYVTHLPNLTGSTQSLLDMIAGLKKMKNIEIVVLIGKHGPLEEKLKELHIAYEYIPYSTDIKDKNSLKNKAKLVKNKLALPRIIQFLKQEHVDIVHSNTQIVSIGNEAAYLAGIPYIIHAREMIKEDHHIDLISDDKMKFYLEHASKVVYISDFVKNKFHKISPKTPYVVLHDGMDVNKYLLPAHDLFSKEEVNLLMAGRISPGKGQMDAVKAIQILNKKSKIPFRLFVVGNPGNNAIDMDYLEQLKTYASTHKLSNIEFISFTDLTDLRKKTDISLVCSTNEAMGRVTLESMLAGCITIGADAGATPELLTDGETGYLYQSGNPDSLASRILYACEHKENAQNITENARNHVYSQFDMHRYAEEIANIYQTVKGEKK